MEQMCERCRKICEDRKIDELKREIQKDKKNLEMLEALREQLGRLRPVLPESFDDLIRLHGKDVIRDWLRAMLD